MDTLTLKKLPGRKQINTTSVGICTRSVFIIFIVLTASILPGHAQKGSTSFSIKYGLFNSKIRFSSGGVFRASIPDAIPSNLALLIRHQFSPAFRFGVESGFFNEKWQVDWVSNPVDNIEREINGRYQRNTLYVLINAEYCIPGAEWLYLVGGIGPAHHFNREVSNARLYTRYPSGNTDILRNVTVSIKDASQVVWKFGAGFNVPIAKTFNIGLDMSYYAFNKTKGTTEYLQNLNDAVIPGIGFSGFVGALSIIMIIPGS